MRNKKTICLALLGLLAGVVIHAQPIILSKNITNVSPCSSSSNGEVTITIRKNGTDQFTYTIYKNFPIVTQSIGPTSDTVVTFTGLEKASYLFILKWDLPSSSILSDWVAVSGPSVINIASQSVTAITCHGDNNGSITVSGSGETGNYVYELFNSVPVKVTENGTGVFTNLSGDTYTVRVSDVTCPGSKTSSPLTVQDPPPISITGTSSANVNCYGASNGSIQVTASGGTGTLTYTISPGGSANNNGLFTNLGPGTYTVSVTDANNCPAAVAGPVTITEPAVLNASVASTNVTCFGSADGTISITSPSGGSGNYQYSINGGSSWQGSGNYTGLPAGAYDVRLRDQAVPTCEVVLSGSLTITQPAVLNATVSSTNVTCFGGNNGSITLSSPTGGSGQYEFTINGGTSWSSSGTFTSLTAGTYDVRMRDKLQPSCEKVLNGSLQITQPLQMSATVSKTDVTGCYGYTNGSITISSPIGGSGVYDFTINGGSSWQGSGSFTNLGAGTYNVQMRDRNAPSCIIILNSSLVINQPAPLTATITTKDVTCFGNDDGEIKFNNPQGGSGSYQFSVNGGTVWRTNGTFSKTAVPPYPITAGTYSLMMRNTLVPYCQTSLGTAVINQPGQLNATLVVTQITCNGASNGTITFSSPSGGSGAYQYSINGGTSWNDNPLFSGLAAGTYNCQIRDKNVPTCSRILNSAVAITEPAALNANVASTNVTCNGANDGTITISNPTGGWGTYEFTINGGTSWQSSGNYTGLAPASYNVQMRDAANPSCIKVLNAALVITQPNALTATVNKTDVTCFGGNDGSIIISNPQGGYGTYEFSINGGSAWQASGTFAGLSAGTYDVRIRDAAHTGCFVVLNPALVISQPGQLNAAVSKTDVTGCYGNNNGAITISSPSGGSGAYQYSINGGSSWEASGTYSGLVAGTYDVRIRDAAAPSCTRILNSALVITQPAQLNGTVSKTDVTCNGGNDGSITISGASGGLGAFEYSVTGYPWQAAATFSGLPAGTYNVFIRDAGNPSCQRTLATGLVISQPAVLTATVAKTDVTCFGGSDGSISITSPAGGHGTYEYSINGGSSWQSAGNYTGLPVGSYNVQIRDAAYPSCFVVLNPALTITQPSLLSAAVAKTDVTCFGGNNGTITISSPSGGHGSYEYSINGGSSWQVSGNFAGLIAGTYDVRMRDALYPVCSVILSGALVINQPAQLTASLSKIDVSCHGGNDGVISISGAAGGHGTYEYSINGGSSWQASGVFAGLTAGTYDVRMRDAAYPACSVVLNPAYQITEPPALTATIATTNVTCHGSADGSITISNAQGGHGTYEFSITGGISWQSSGVFTGLPAGFYDVRIRDAAYPICSTILNPALEITQPGLLTAVISSADVTCSGGSDGSITLSGAQGGHGHYEYSISGGTSWQANGSFTGLPSGSYDVRMRDADFPGCFVVLNPALTINEPLPLSGTVNKTDVTGCYGNTNGSISVVSAAGGSGSYEFTIDGGVSWQVSPVFNNLAAGTYDVRMRDAVAPRCEKILDNALTIFQPQELYGETSFTDVACHGEASGTITIGNTSGGSGSYEFSINGGTTWQASPSFGALPAGSYTVMMRDAATPSCVLVLMDPLLISEPEAISLTINKKDLRCNGIPDGILSITASGGTGAYQYSIDNGLNFFPAGDFSNLSAGNYPIAVKDGNGCRVDSAVALIEPDPIVILNEVSEDETCYHSGDGWIHIFASGGAGHLIYSIDGGVTYFDNGGLFSNLSEGNYQSAVRDDSACFVTGNFLPVLSPPELIISGVSSNNVTCHGAGDGTITISASGGTGTIRFSIDGGANYLNNGGFFTNVPAGNYSVMITDSIGCTTAGPEVVITEPPAFTAPDVTIVNISCSGQTDGSILVTPNGGTPPYTYILKENGIEKDTVTSAGSGLFTGLSANTYTVRITDANLCGTIETPPLVIVEPAPLVFDSVSVQPVLCPGTSTGGILIFAHGGTPVHPLRPYDYTIDGGVTWDTIQYLNIPAGIYHTGVRDKRGCFVMGDTVTLTDPPAIQLDSVSVVDVTGCWYDATGSITIYASGGQGALTYSIGSSYSPSNVFSGLTSGAYPLWVKDAMGCIDSVGQAIVHGPMPITASIRKHDVDGDIPGSIVISASGGGGMFEYSIDDGMSFAPADSFPGLASGKYYVVVRDQYDCRYRDSIQIEEISSMQVVYSLTPVSCNGGNDGIISMVADLGTPPYQYSIDNGLNFYDFGYFSDLSAGDYIVLIKDASNHRYRDTVTVQQPEPISVIATIDNANCSSLLPGFTDVGAISLNVSGGNGGYTFAWTKDGQPAGTSQNLANLTAGLYTVQVTDNKGCSSTKSYAVGSDPAKNISINPIPDQNVCSNVALDLTASSPQNVSYKWIRVSDGAEISSQPAVTIPPGESGTYVAVAYNTFNCAAYDTVNVLMYPVPALSMVRDTMILGGVTMTLPLQLTDTAGLSETVFSWSNDIWLDDPSSMNPQFTPDKSSDVWDFVVTATTAHNCVATDSITVHVLWELMVPSGFSPNGDGYNDVWFIPAAQFVRVDVEVFNRWGEKVYSAKNYKNDWDGKYKGKPLGIGTYYYVVTIYAGGKVKTMTGPLTILVQPK